MEEVIRNVADIDTADRQALEHVLGRRLAEDQQIIIRVINPDLSQARNGDAPAAQAEPPWANIYEGLSDEEIDRLDQAIRQRANLTRIVE